MVKSGTKEKDGETWMEPVKKAELLRDMQKDNEKIIIHAGPEIATLIVGYHRKRRKDIIRMRNALGNADYETIGVIGHSMRGSGAGYCFNTITDIGIVPEQAAKQSNKDEIKRRIGELEDYVG